LISLKIFVDESSKFFVMNIRYGYAAEQNYKK
jgi:hypothetical protein